MTMCYNNTTNASLHNRLLKSFISLGILIAIGGIMAKLNQHNERNSLWASISGQTAAGTVSAFEFPPGLDWINTDHPITMRELRGKIVLLDFWTYCCINCMHILPELKRLERQFPDELVVIGVHSAKFDAERDTDNIRQAVKRYEIEHPVVNDPEMILWRKYHIRAWPSFVLIDPEGNVVGKSSGEGIYEPFKQLISKLILTFDARGTLNRQPLHLETAVGVDSGLLSFPGKVLAYKPQKRLFIADTNHNRILAVALETGDISTVIGSGKAGFTDGTFDTARFHHPQGMVYDGKLLYIADTENHTVRVADMTRKTVSTLAGTGEKARHWNISGPAQKIPLNSPWDLTLVHNRLYIAMAGSHQIWEYDIKSHDIKPYAGSASEGRIDGPRLQGALAQPSGLTSDGNYLYVADSESSCIRAIGLSSEGRIETLVGGDLFVFGDRDGIGSEARLKHPLGIAYQNGILYIADTYNDKVKRLFPTVKRIETILGGEHDKAKVDSGQKILQLDEPGGLTIIDTTLYIADTNNHRILKANIRTGTLTVLNLRYHGKNGGK